MNLTRILGLAIAASVFASFAALAAAGTPDHQRGTIAPETPARIDNIWGGFDHQPDESRVQTAERAHGIAPTAQEQARETQILRQLNQQLLRGTGAGSAGAAAG